jgi:hypothetical protein
MCKTIGLTGRRIGGDVVLVRIARCKGDYPYRFTASHFDEGREDCHSELD